MVVPASKAGEVVSAVAAVAAVAEAATADETSKGGTAMLAGKAKACGLFLLLLLAACTASSGPTFSSGGGFGYASSSGGSGSSGGTTPGRPMLVDVDTNRTMTAKPGDGVGIFTEYAAGGHWHVWWTCDSNQTGADCSFDVSASPSDGPLANVAGEGLAATDQLLQPAAGAIQVITQTSTGIAGVTFDTTPGSIVTLEAKMNGAEDGRILFFVQADQVNGGYTGTLTDPLMFEPSSP
jgi:hypothetical protein